MVNETVRGDRSSPFTILLDSTASVSWRTRINCGNFMGADPTAERLLVQWSEGEAFWPLNVEDALQLPPPTELGNDRRRHVARSRGK